MYMFSEMIVLQLSETIFIMIIGRVWTILRPRGLVRVFSVIEYGVLWKIPARAEIYHAFR